MAEAFRQGALGLLNLMVDLDRIKPLQKVIIRCAADDPAGLFVQMLNELLTQRDLEGVFLGDFRITCLTQGSDGYRLEGVAYGEPVDIERHRPKTEIKAATYGGLSYTVDEETGKHVVQCVLDL
jgi:SHS2 domain-containing protein